MKKIYIALFAAVLALACTPETEEYQPDTTLYTSGTVNLCASIEELQTKMVMDLTGRGIWSEGDKIAVACSDGSFVEFELNGTGETKRAVFTGNIPEGKTLGRVAVWPATAVVGMDGDNLTVKVPTEYSTDGLAYDGVMVANISDSWEITFRHVLARPTFVLKNYPSAASYLTLEADGKSLGGRLSLDINSENGIVATNGSQILKVETLSAGTTISFTVNMPVYEYNTVTVKLYDEKDVLLLEQVINELKFETYRAGMSSLTASLEALPEVYEPVDVEYIEVCGIKWAKGNLQVKQGATQKGMQDGWRIAPEQWHFFKYKEAYDNAVEKGNGAPARYDYKNSGTEFEHFTYGALARNARYYSDNDNGNWMKPTVEGFSLQGSIYSDRKGETLIAGGNERWANSGTFTTNNSEIWGDLAYWASRGAYMTPTYAQMEKLRTEADVQYGYVLEAGVKIWGIYFTDPASPGAPVINKTEREITAAELEKGLFLPKAGRRNNASSDTVIAATQQCTYRSSTYIGSGVCASGTLSGKTLNYSYVLHFNGTSMSWQTSTTSAYDNGAGFLIRPVVNDAYDPDNI